MKRSDEYIVALQQHQNKPVEALLNREINAEIFSDLKEMIAKGVDKNSRVWALLALFGPLCRNLSNALLMPASRGEAKVIGKFILIAGAQIRFASRDYSSIPQKLAEITNRYCEENPDAEFLPFEISDILQDQNEA